MRELGKQAFSHWLIYFAQNALTALASLMFLPLYTRILGPRDYGAVVLVDSSIALAVAIAKLGLPQSSVRFYWPLYREGQAKNFYSTQLLTSLATSLGIVLLLEFMVVWIPRGHTLRTLQVAAPLVALGSFFEVLLSFDRAAERSFRYALGHVLERYFLLAAGGVGYIAFKTVDGVYIARIVVCIVLVSLFLRRNWHLLDPTKFSIQLMKKSLSYGVPLLLLAVQSIVLSFGDRYILWYLQGKQAVGIYSAAYSLASGIGMLIVAPFNLFAQPVYMKGWAENQVELVKAMLKKLTGFYFLLSVPLVFGVLMIGRELLLILVSAQYERGSTTMIYVTAGVILYGLSYITGAGLYILKRTRTIALVLTASVMLNFVLNFSLIPLMGLDGAALATLVSYAVYTLVLSILAARVFPFNVDWVKLVKALFCSVIMASLLRYLAPQTISELVASIGIGIACYGSIIIIIDTEVRDVLFEQVRALTRSLRRGP